RQETQQLLARLVAFDNLVGDVGAIERRREDFRRSERQLVDNVFAGMRISSRGQRYPRHARIMLGKVPEFAVFRPEIMPPLRNAMRFVYGEQRDRRSADHLLETWRDDPLRRDIEKVE